MPGTSVPSTPFGHGSRAPRLSLAGAARLLRERWGLEGALEDFPSYADRNVLVRCEGGGRWVLKLANRDEEPQTLAFQNAALERLDEREPGLAPRLRSSLAGHGVEQVLDDEGEPHLARVLSFVPGVLLARVDRSQPATWSSLGEVLGRIARAFEGFTHPGMQRVLLWDLAQSAWTIGEAERFPPVGRALLERLQLEFLGHYARSRRRLPRAVIFGDANEHNLVVGEHDRVPRVRGLFDFGDAIHTARVFDLAIAAAYAVLDREDPLGPVMALLEGYRRHVEPTDDELEVLFPALCMRLVVSVVSSARRAALEPENRYLRISEASAWRAIERLVAVTPAAALSAFRRAIDAPPGRPWPASEVLLARRRRVLGPSLSLSYRAPLQIVRGAGTWLFDEHDRAFLDGVNNVCHVGHAHPHVVEAGARQLARLDTNTRYLHENVLEYAERLGALFPAPLSVCFFVNSGSEANELALRLARTATGRHDMLVTDAGYHGNTGTLIDLSAYKHDGPGGSGPPPWVHKVPCPDAYRGPFRGEGEAVCRDYLASVERELERARAAGRPVAGFLCEAISGCGGQIVAPAGWLRGAFELVRAHGGLAIADEVQTGFGRVGSAWWAFELDGAVPDIVTLGKPMGNGHPLGAVVTTPEIAARFANGMEYFNTFGGSPVSCAIGLAVLDVLEQEGLRANARATGARLASGFCRLQERHACIGDVRGAGLFLGVELVRDRDSREPAPELLARAIEAARRDGVLLSADGPDHNVLKVKPPLVIRPEDADLLLACFDRALAGVDTEPGSPPPPKAE